MTDCSFSVEVVGEVIKGSRRIRVVDNETDGFIFPPGYKSFIEAEENLLRSLSVVDASIAASLLWKWLIGGKIYGSIETSCGGCLDGKEE